MHIWCVHILIFSQLLITIITSSNLWQVLLGLHIDPLHHLLAPPAPHCVETHLGNTIIFFVFSQNIFAVLSLWHDSDFTGSISNPTFPKSTGPTIQLVPPDNSKLSVYKMSQTFVKSFLQPIFLRPDFQTGCFTFVTIVLKHTNVPSLSKITPSGWNWRQVLVLEPFLSWEKWKKAFEHIDTF